VVQLSSGLRGYRPRQAQVFCQQRDQASRNAFQNDHVMRKLVAECLNLQGSPEQISAALPVSHETIYQHVYELTSAIGVLINKIRTLAKNINANTRVSERKIYAFSNDDNPTN
jgi:IS30 family transposase